MRSFFLAAFALTVACGGRVTSIDGNQSTTSLTPADQDQLCLDTYNWTRSALSTDDLAKLECGFAQSNDPSSCDQTYASCVTAAKANVQQIQWPLAPDCTGFDAAVAKCNTTVAEYTKCLQQEVEAVKAMESSFPICTSAEQESAGVTALSQLSTDCIALMQTCQITFAPGIGSSGSSNGGVPDAGPPDGG